MKYTIQIENVSRYIIGALIKSFKDLCPKGVKAIWIEDSKNSTDKMKTGKIDVITKFNNKEKQVYDAKVDIENKLKQLTDKAEADKQAWFEQEKAKNQAEFEAKKQAEKEKRAEELAKRNTFAELFDRVELESKNTQKVGKWPKKEKVVAHAVCADDGHIDLVKYLCDQPKEITAPQLAGSCWAKGAPVVHGFDQQPAESLQKQEQRFPVLSFAKNVKKTKKESEASLPFVSAFFGQDLYQGAWADLDEEYTELDQRFAQGSECADEEDPWSEGVDVYAQYEEVY